MKVRGRQEVRAIPVEKLEDGMVEKVGGLITA